MFYSRCIPGAIVQPFGSSVNGFGKHDGDLDMIIKLKDHVSLHFLLNFHENILLYGKIPLTLCSVLAPLLGVL